MEYFCLSLFIHVPLIFIVVVLFVILLEKNVFILVDVSLINSVYINVEAIFYMDLGGGVLHKSTESENLN